MNFFSVVSPSCLFLYVIGIQPGRHNTPASAYKTTDINFLSLCTSLSLHLAVTRVTTPRMVHSIPILNGELIARPSIAFRRLQKKVCIVRT